MHLFAPEIGMMGTSGIVGPSILQACGGGYSSKILKNRTVAVAFRQTHPCEQSVSVRQVVVHPSSVQTWFGRVHW